jgi:7,8-dihydroneopterin aldolase/epimerase/oxygenase
MRRPSDTDDFIHIQELELSACIGVPDEERVAPQRLTASITLWPGVGFDTMHDRLEATVDYAAVCREVVAFVAGRGDKLLETLAAELTSHLLGTFAVMRVRLELRKFVLRDVSYVGVTLVRER